MGFHMLLLSSPESVDVLQILFVVLSHCQTTLTHLATGMFATVATFVPCTRRTSKNPLPM